MTDDLTQKVADAIHDALAQDAGPAVLDGRGLMAHGLARAALDAVIAQGGVTDDDIGLAAAWNSAPNRYVAVRDLLARGIVTACAERDAEIERLRGRRGPDNEAWHEGRKRGSDEAHAAHRATTDTALARAERAEAQVQRVRAWADDACWCGQCGDLDEATFRAALDGEADR